MLRELSFIKPLNVQSGFHADYLSSLMLPCWLFILRITQVLKILPNLPKFVNLAYGFWPLD